MLRATRTRRSLWACLATLLIAPPLLAAPPPASPPLPQVWTGRIIAPAGLKVPLAADLFQLKIFRVSDDKEIQSLLQELARSGQPGLREAIFRLPGKGWISIGRSVATEVSVIRVIDLPDGHRRVRVFSAFPLRLYDKSDPYASKEHPFAFLELSADASGTGTGTLVAAASLAVGDEGLRIESAGAPVMNVVDVTTDSPPTRPAAP